MPVRRGRRRGGAAFSLPLTSLALGVERAPDADLALISVPGDYAAAEAMKALALGLHVMLFSDNVRSPTSARSRRTRANADLLVMGPDCGTAIVNGVPLGFANVVRRGDIGLVAASGTGLQEVTCRIHNLGGGVSQALGTGGRDLKEEIGGITMLQGLAALAADPRTRVIVLISKPPCAGDRAPDLDAAAAAGKPVVVHFLGAAPRRSLRPGLVAATFVAARGRRRRGAGPRRRAPTAEPRRRAAGDRRRRRLGRARWRRRRRGARALHRRHVLLRGAARVHRARPARAAPMRRRTGAAVRRPRRRATTATCSSTWATTTTRAGGRIR